MSAINDPILVQGEVWKARLAPLALQQQTQAAQPQTQEPETPAITKPEQTPFMRRASILIERGIPVAPLPPLQKFAPPKEWEKLATTDIAKLAAMNPHADGNTAAVARAEIGGFCFFEVDKSNFHTTIQDQTGHNFPDTLMVSSSPGNGRGHIYLRHTPKSIAFQQQIGKAYISGKDENGKEAWSFRMNNAYVVGPLSIKQNGDTYKPLNSVSIADCPDWFIDWLSANNTENKKTGHAELDAESPIVEGSRNNTITSILGKARQNTGAEYEVLIALARQHNRRCVPPLPNSELETIAHSISRYKVTAATPVMFNGLAHGQQPQTTADEIEVPKLNKQSYPVFPNWVMAGTSIYEGFVKPVCERNSRIPYFMFLPAAALMMNYLGTKIRVKDHNNIPSFFMVLIGEKGRAIKSSSVEDAVEYLHFAGVMDHAGFGIRNAEGKSLVWTVGSPEGLGMDMSRTNCKNAVLFYDELSGLTAKAEIDSSSLRSSLLTLYESGKFANTIKGRKETYNISPEKLLRVVDCLHHGRKLRGPVV